MATVDDIAARTERMLDLRNYVNPMRDALDIIRNEEKQFPPQPDRMRSGHLNTWAREVGRLPVSAFIKVKREKWPGGVIATIREQRKRIKRSPGDILQPSEKMLREWIQMPIVIALTAEGLVGVGMNRASYSGYVQGQDQTHFHKETGWLTTVEAERKHHDLIAQKFVDQAMRLIGGQVI